MFLLKLAMRPWREAALGQVFSALAVGLLLSLSGFLISMEVSLTPLIARLESEQILTVYLEQGETEKTAVDQIKTQLGAAEIKAEIKSVGAEDFLNELGKHYPELEKELKAFGQEAVNLVPRYLSVTGSFSESTLDAIKKVKGVESLETSKDRYLYLVGSFKALQWILRSIVLGLGIALLTGLIHLSKTNSALHRESVSLLELWGAGPLHLKLPSLISALSVGLLGGTVAAIGWALGGPWLATQVRNFSPILSNFDVATLLPSVLMVIVGGALGGSVGWVAKR